MTVLHRNPNCHTIQMSSTLPTEDIVLKRARQGVADCDPDWTYFYAVCHAEGNGVTQSYSEAAMLFRKAAELGCTDAMAELGRCLEHGLGVKRDIKQARTWYKAAADRGNVLGMLRLACSYPASGPSHREQTEAWFRKAAEAGNGKAMYCLAIYLKRGEHGWDQDLEESVTWLARAVDKENPDAMYVLGRCYAEGEGVEKNLEMATELYRKAAEHDNPHGMLMVAQRALESGDKSEAFKWFGRLQKDFDNAEGMYGLGWCYQNGIGVDTDEVQAVDWYKKAVERGNRRALFHLGSCYAKGLGGLPKDERKAFVLYQEAERLNVPGTAYAIGLCFLEGKGVEKDLEKGLAYLNRAASEGDVKAMNSLAKCFAEGIGVAIDKTKAIEWLSKASDAGDHISAQRLVWFCENLDLGKDESFRLYKEAAERGNTGAMYNLAKCYQKGLGAEQDLDAAIHWYSQAEKKCIKAAYKLGRCFEVRDDPRLSVEWYQTSGTRGYPKGHLRAGIVFETKLDAPRKAFEEYKLASEQLPEAMVRLGRCYERGLGTDTDFDFALDWYKRAADMGSVEAMYKYGRLLGKRDGPTACSFGWFMNAAKQGHAEAMNEIGRCYGEGVGFVGKDPAKAFEWYKKAAEAGSIRATHNLAICYRFGLGVERDLDEALRLYHAAYDGGHSEAAYDLGLCYEHGILVGKDEAKSRAYYAEAVKRGGLDRAFLGRCYLEGLGVEKDTNRGKDLLFGDLSSKNGRAAYILGRAYLNGKEGINRDESNAVHFLKRAADAGHADAIHLIGRCYKYGFGGLPTDGRKTLDLLQEAARKGSIDAMVHLGWTFWHDTIHIDWVSALTWYEQAADAGYGEGYYKCGILLECGGNGLEKDDVRAFKCFVKAAKRGHVLSMFKVAQWYEEGRGCTKNAEVAWAYYYMAAVRHSHVPSMVELSRFEELGVTRPPNLTKAAEWLTKAAELRDERAMFKLAHWFEEGIGVEKDDAAALRWLNAATSVKYSEGMYRLGLYYMKRGEMEKAHAHFNKTGWHLGARGQLGICKLRGIGCEVDLDAAIQYLEGPSKSDPKFKRELAFAYMQKSLRLSMELDDGAGEGKAE